MDLSSFSELLRHRAPHLLPVGSVGSAPGDALPHGTTIVALKYPGGVLIAGDRRSTQSHMIAGRDVQKVYITDDYTATGIAGTAAIAVEFARLYAVELERYEKLEGVPLTFAGKVNRLAIMVRGTWARRCRVSSPFPCWWVTTWTIPIRPAPPDRLVRRGGRLEHRGGGLSVGRFRIPFRAVVDQEAVFLCDGPGFGAEGCCRGTVRRRRRRLGDRRTRPGPRHLPDRGDHRCRRRQ